MVNEWAYRQILGVLADTPGHSAYGSQIARASTVSVELVYRALERFHDLGWVSLQDPRPGDGNRRHYQLTPLGHRAAEIARTRKHTIDTLMRASHATA